jgi:hypothetical protein
MYLLLGSVVQLILFLDYKYLYYLFTVHCTVCWVIFVGT